MAWLGSIFGGTGGNSGGSEFVGQYVDLGKQKLRIKKVIAEGGYGFVFIAQDTTTNKEYALKRLMAADDVTSKLIVKEVSFLRKLRGHPNIVQYIAAASGEENKDRTIKEYLILTELCSGQLVEYMNAQSGQPLLFQQVLKIFAQLCKAVIHMHKQTPAIIHRDLKIENMLFSAKGTIKICDFGSATSEAIYPDDSWTALQRSTAEEEIQRNTTPMYRAPEMVDLYSNYSVTTKADVWALGCILYFLCFMGHPFEDSAKLKIMNANYTIPETDKTFEDFHHLINSMLKVNPDERANTEDVFAELISIGADQNVDLKAPIIETAIGSVAAEQEQSVAAAAAASSVASNYGSSVLLGSVVNRAGALFSNIKDVSSKVMNSMAGYARNDMDISYITSRLLVMSFPADGIEGTYKNNIEDVRMFLDTKHPDGYVVINISQRTYRTAKLNDRVYDSGWNPKRSPSLEKLVSLCRKLNNFLKQNKNNVVVVHCLDGKVASALLLCSFFLFCKLFSKVSMAVHLFNLKRCTIEEQVVLTPSQIRYCEYVGKLVAPSRIIPHDNIVFLKSFSISPIPIFNKARSGCRPFVEIYENDKRILNTAKEIDEMREYNLEDGKIVFQTHIRLHGDITVLVHHGRSTLGGKVQGKLTSINIFSLQFYTGFLKKDSPNAVFSIDDLDVQEPGDKYPDNFGVCLNVKFTEETPDKMCTMPWEKMHVDKLSPYVSFSTREEYWLLHEEYGLSEEIADEEAISSTSSLTDNSPSLPIASPETEEFFKIDKEAITTLPHTTITSALPQTTTTTAPSLFDSVHEEGKDVCEMRNQSIADLIDMSPSNQRDDIEDDYVASDDFCAFSEAINYTGNAATTTFNGPLPHIVTTSTASHIEVIDPFESLANSRNSQVMDDDSPILLNLDRTLTDDCTKTPDFTSGFDLINSINESSGKQSSPDILPNRDILQNEFVPIKRNRSLDDVNCDDLFGKFDEHKLNITKNSANNLNSLNSLNDLNNLNNTNNSNDKSKQAIDPFLRHFNNSPRKSNSESNLLGDWGDGAIHTETLTPEVQHASSTASLNKTPVYDPLSEFGNFNMDGFSTKGFQKAQSTTKQQNTASRLSPTPLSQGPPVAQAKPGASPNYNVFITPWESGNYPMGKSTAQKSTGWVPKPVNSNEFNDLLDAQGFVKSNAPPDPLKSSLKSLRDQQDDQNDVDPIKKKVREWSDNKERNIRALLTSLHTVLWESEDKWQQIGIHQVMQAADVKKFYRRACLAVHPDKHTGEPHEELSRAIFIELNQSWSLYQESGSNNLV